MQPWSWVAKDNYSWKESCVFVWEGLGGHRRKWMKYVKRAAWMDQPRMRWAWKIPSHHRHNVLPPGNSDQCYPMGKFISLQKRDVSAAKSWCSFLSPYGCGSPSFFALPSSGGTGCVEGQGEVTTAFWSVQGSFIIQQLSQHLIFFFFLGGEDWKKWSNFQKLIRKATEKKASGMFSFQKCVQIHNKSKWGRKNLEEICENDCYVLISYHKK